jgi:guanylate kinase
MEWGIKNHEFLEYGEHNGNLYGTKLDSVRAIIDEGKTCILDSSPQSLKILRNSSEFMPFIIFLVPMLKDLFFFGTDDRAS